MTPKFWSDVGSKLIGPWAASLVTPAFLFWAGGIGAGIWAHGGEKALKELEAWVLGRPPAVRIALLVASLLIVAATGAVAQRLDRPTLRLLEGYWPWPVSLLRRPILKAIRASKIKAERRFQELADKDVMALSEDEFRERFRLDEQLRRYPNDDRTLMPTALGNTLRSAEAYSEERYGLNAFVCWARLWLLLPDGAKKELAEVRASLDAAAIACLWGALFIVWTFWAWWAAPLGIAVVVLGYLEARRVATAFADLLEGAFDLHRWKLYEALHWPLPKDPGEEREHGGELSAYLYRGSDSNTPKFTKAAAGDK